jgi:hypothetical protein
VTVYIFGVAGRAARTENIYRLDAKEWMGRVGAKPHVQPVGATADGMARVGPIVPLREPILSGRARTARQTVLIARCQTLEEVGTSVLAWHSASKTDSHLFRKRIKCKLSATCDPACDPPEERGCSLTCRSATLLDGALVEKRLHRHKVVDLRAACDIASR